MAEPFVFLTEQHIIGDISHLMYYPEVQRFYRSVLGVVGVWGGPEARRQMEEAIKQMETAGPAGAGAHREPQTPKTMAEAILKGMDEAGIDIITLLRESFMDTTGYAACWSTNGQVMEVVEQAPERFMLESNVGPVIRRGWKNANWELEYLVKNHGVRLNKVYQVEDDGPLNDPRMYPFYEKAQELGVVLTIHMGEAYVTPQLGKRSLPILLDDVCTEFPSLKIIGYHIGWPYHEELFGLAGKHEGLYVGLSGTIGWMARAPYKGYHFIGEALEWAGADKIVMGSDGGPEDLKRRVDFIRNLDIPVEMQQQYGYPKITQEIRDKILGLNLARITGVEPRKRL